MWGHIKLRTRHFGSGVGYGILTADTTTVIFTADSVRVAGRQRRACACDIQQN